MSFDIKSGRHPIGVSFLGFGIDGQENDHFGPQPTSTCISSLQDQKRGQSQRNVASGLIFLDPFPLGGSVTDGLSLKEINLPTACSDLGFEEHFLFDSPSTPLHGMKTSKSHNEGHSVRFSFAIPASPTEEHAPKHPVPSVNATSPKEGQSPRCCTSFLKLTVGAPPVYQSTERTALSALIAEPALRAFIRHRQSLPTAAEKCPSSTRIASMIPSAYTYDFADSLRSSSRIATNSSMVSDSFSTISQRCLSMRDSTTSHSSMFTGSTCSVHQSVDSHSRAFPHYQYDLKNLNTNFPDQASWYHRGVLGSVMSPRHNLLKVGEMVDLEGFQAPAYYGDSAFNKDTKIAATFINQCRPRSQSLALISAQVGLAELVDSTTMMTSNATRKSSGAKSLISRSFENMRENRGSSSIPSRFSSFDSMAITRATFSEKKTSPQVDHDLSEETVEQGIVRLHQIAGEVLARTHRVILEKNRAFVNDLKLPKLAMGNIQSGPSEPHIKEPAGYVYGVTTTDLLEDSSKNRPRRRKLPLISFSKVNKWKYNGNLWTWTEDSSTSCSFFPSKFKSKNILNALYRSAKHRKIAQAASFDVQSFQNASTASRL